MQYGLVVNSINDGILEMLHEAGWYFPTQTHKSAVGSDNDVVGQWHIDGSPSRCQSPRD
jgi:hypothetical protein